jgi:oligosaccharide repeat unit polymerase
LKRPIPLLMQSPNSISNVGVQWPLELQRHIIVKDDGKEKPRLPSYCNPIVLFMLSWVLMLVCLSAKVTYVSYPNLLVPIYLFAGSAISLLIGYWVTCLLLQRGNQVKTAGSYLLDVTELRRLNILFCGIALAIIAFNWVTLGPPPALGDPTSYLTYGRFRQVLFPVLTIIAVNATLESSLLRKLLFVTFAFLGLALYITRGLMVVTLLQMFFLFSLRTKIEVKKLYWMGIACLALLIAGATVVGNIRTAQFVFFEFLQIREEYFDWPMAYLWLTSYVSVPLSNLCWILTAGHYHGPTLAFLYPLLPSFIAPVDPHLAFHDDMRVIDGASTYLADYVLDFSYFGVYFANLALGIGSGWLKERGLSRHFLVSSILLAAMSLISFSDMFIPLSTVIQIVMQCVVQRKCFIWPSDLERAEFVDGGG